ncbi:putative membrane protein YkoI [Streptomyces sp. 840.1]|uniref:PepSY domain-containing protein n=1 Tax=Streptomyces sp. 840.1 TaxID=2485152 RepID=UPI000F467CB6|nr:PepSY domain-containing protein [Streptomyces sp. 840.1]ROQ65954.1 putative membrane protein YkoI [Streptomyces sp. 840.1]
MKRKIVIAAVTAAVLAAGGTATAVALAGGGPTSGTPGRDSARVTVGDAAAAAVRAVPGTVTEAELDDEDGRLVWELDVYGSERTRHDVTVDPADGKVLADHVDSDDGDRSAPRKTSVTLDDAVRAALGSVPGTVTSVELEDHDGRTGRAVHWEVDVRGKDGAKHELDVDAKTAKVTVDRPDSGHGGDDGDGDDHDDD